jgi:hypothetical protein
VDRIESIARLMNSLVCSDGRGRPTPKLRFLDLAGAMRLMRAFRSIGKPRMRLAPAERIGSVP